MRPIAVARRAARTVGMVTYCLRRYLRRLGAALREGGEPCSADRVDLIAEATAAEVIEFVTSLDRWGGLGSLADQAGSSAQSDARREIRGALVALGDEQLRLGVGNPRTAGWMAYFREQ